MRQSDVEIIFKLFFVFFSATGRVFCRADGSAAFEACDTCDEVTKVFGQSVTLCTKATERKLVARWTNAHGDQHADEPGELSFCNNFRKSAHCV